MQIHHKYVPNPIKVRKWDSDGRLFLKIIVVKGTVIAGNLIFSKDKPVEQPSPVQT